MWASFGPGPSRNWARSEASLWPRGGPDKFCYLTQFVSRALYAVPCVRVKSEVYFGLKRYSRQAPAYTPGSAVDFYRVEFYRVLDTVDAQITERFMQPGTHTLKELENSLLTTLQMMQQFGNILN